MENLKIYRISGYFNFIDHGNKLMNFIVLAENKEKALDYIIDFHPNSSCYSIEEVELIEGIISING